MAPVLTKRESERERERTKKRVLAKFAYKVNPPLDKIKSINDNHNNNCSFHNVITVDVKRAALAVDPRSFKVFRDVMSASLCGSCVMR